jgi:hypothetical protein
MMQRRVLALSAIYAGDTSMSLAEAARVLPALPRTPDGRYQLVRTAPAWALQQADGSLLPAPRRTRLVSIEDADLSPDDRRIALLHTDISASEDTTIIDVMDISDGRYFSTVRLAGIYDRVRWTGNNHYVAIPQDDQDDPLDDAAQGQPPPVVRIDADTGRQLASNPSRCFMALLADGSLIGGGLGNCRSGAGNDTYYVYAASTQMQEASIGGSQDLAYIGVDNFVGISGIEQIRALETNAYSAKALTSDPYRDGLDSGWRINGDSTDQILVGLYGADFLNGGGGSDLLIGGAGNDVYFYSGTETILENASEGRDTIQTNADLILGANIEIGIALPNSSDVSITGNTLDNILIGNASANNLSGGDGNDTLVSRGGEDMLTGSTGADTFVLNGQDNFLGEITDFQSGLDRISLLVSDPSITLSMAPEDGFTGVAGQLWAVGGAVMIDWNGNAQLDSILLLNETPLLSDFMLIDQNQYQYF